MRRRASVARVVPASSAIAPAPRAPGMHGAPRPYELDTLAHIVTSLPPLVYAAALPSSSPIASPPTSRLSPVPTEPPPSSPTSTTTSSIPQQHAASPASASQAAPLAAELAAPPLQPQLVARHRLFLHAPSLHDSDGTSDEYLSAAESSVASTCSAYVDAPLAATPTLRERRLCKRSSSSLRASGPRPLDVDVDVAARDLAPPSSPLSPSSPASPAQPDQKRRLLSSDKPLPARPPKSAARRASTDASRLLGAGAGSGAGVKSGASGLSRADEREVVGRHGLCVPPFSLTSSRWLWLTP